MNADSIYLNRMILQDSIRPISEHEIGARGRIDHLHCVEVPVLPVPSIVE